MNHSYTRASDAVSADAVNSCAFLQQAVDHYPRLVAFSFTLKFPYRATMSDYRSLILRFHTEVWQRTGEYSEQRQKERRNSPPTILRWMWESVSAPECKMVLLMNLDTLGAWRDEDVLQEMNGLLRGAWCTVTGTDRNGVTSITPSSPRSFRLNRKASQNALASYSPITIPIIFRRRSRLTAQAIITAMLTTRPFLRTFT